jgi:ribosomal protein S4
MPQSSSSNSGFNKVAYPRWKANYRSLQRLNKDVWGLRNAGRKFRSSKWRRNNLRSSDSTRWAPSSRASQVMGYGRLVNPVGDRGAYFDWVRKFRKRRSARLGFKRARFMDRVYNEELKIKEMALSWYLGLKDSRFKRLSREDRDILYIRLEQRLDAVLLRSGFIPNPGLLRQWIMHGMFEVNGRCVTSRNYVLRSGDVVSIRKDLLQPMQKLFAQNCLRQPWRSHYMQNTFGKRRVKLQSSIKQSGLPDWSTKLYVDVLRRQFNGRIPDEFKAPNKIDIRLLGRLDNKSISADRFYNNWYSILMEEPVSSVVWLKHKVGPMLSKKPIRWWIKKPRWYRRKRRKKRGLNLRRGRGRPKDSWSKVRDIRFYNLVNFGRKTSKRNVRKFKGKGRSRNIRHREGRARSRKFPTIVNPIGSVKTSPVKGGLVKQLRSVSRVIRYLGEQPFPPKPTLRQSLRQNKLNLAAHPLRNHRSSRSHVVTKPTNLHITSTFLNPHLGLSVLRRRGLPGFAHTVCEFDGVYMVGSRELRSSFWKVLKISRRKPRRRGPKIMRRRKSGKGRRSPRNLRSGRKAQPKKCFYYGGKRVTVGVSRSKSVVTHKPVRRKKASRVKSLARTFSGKQVPQQLWVNTSIKKPVQVVPISPSFLKSGRLSEGYRHYLRKRRSGLRVQRARRNHNRQKPVNRRNINRNHRGNINHNINRNYRGNINHNHNRNYRGNINHNHNRNYRGNINHNINHNHRGNINRNRNRQKPVNRRNINRNRNKGRRGKRKNRFKNRTRYPHYLESYRRFKIGRSRFKKSQKGMWVWLDGFERVSYGQFDTITGSMRDRWLNNRSSVNWFSDYIDVRNSRRQRYPKSTTLQIKRQAVRLQIARSVGKSTPLLRRRARADAFDGRRSFTKLFKFNGYKRKVKVRKARYRRLVFGSRKVKRMNLLPWLYAWAGFIDYDRTSRVMNMRASGRRSVTVSTFEKRVGTKMWGLRKLWSDTSADFVGSMFLWQKLKWYGRLGVSADHSYTFDTDFLDRKTAPRYTNRKDLRRVSLSNVVRQLRRRRPKWPFGRLWPWWLPGMQDLYDNERSIRPSSLVGRRLEPAFIGFDPRTPKYLEVNHNILEIVLIREPSREELVYPRGYNPAIADRAAFRR